MESESRWEGSDMMEKIKEEVEVSQAQVAGQWTQDSGQWDSGIVLDSSTVVQMAEFQEVVDNMTRSILPPPPYPYHTPQPTVVVTQPITVTDQRLPLSVDTSLDSELEQMIHVNPVMSSGPQQQLPQQACPSSSHNDCP